MPVSFPPFQQDIAPPLLYKLSFDVSKKVGQEVSTVDTGRLQEGQIELLFMEEGPFLT